MDDGAFNDEDCNQNLIDEVNIVDIGGFTTIDEDSCFNNVDVSKGSSTPMDQALAVATLTWSSVGVKPNTWKSGDLESSGTPECSELNSKGQTPRIEVFLMSLKRS